MVFDENMFFRCNTIFNEYKNLNIIMNINSNVVRDVRYTVCIQLRYLYCSP